MKNILNLIVCFLVAMVALSACSTTPKQVLDEDAYLVHEDATWLPKPEAENYATKANPVSLQRGVFSGYSIGSIGDSGGNPPLPPVNGGTPGLSGFRFNFQKGDHHIAGIRANFDQSTCRDGWCFMYKDRHLRTAYYYDIRWQELPKGAIYEAKYVSLKGFDTTIYRLGDATPGTTPVLTGFSWSLKKYTDDMHFSGLSARVYTENGSVYAYAWFHDKDWSHARDGFIAYAEIPNAHIQTKPTIQGWSPGKAAGGSLSAQFPILQGFGITFLKQDHHIDRVGAEVWPGNWRVTCDDKNNDDEFLYYLYWADLIP